MPARRGAMDIDKDERMTLVQTIINEASNIDLLFYLARTDGEAAVRDLMECIRDVEKLDVTDLLYNISVLRQKKAEAHGCHMVPVFRRLLKSDSVSLVAPEFSGEPIGADSARLH
jgi:hypothetical protein